MSVSVQHLTKVYGAQKAVDDISFEAKKGEVLGFLGPNGAGKTTSMKIITCYIPQTSGKVEVCGFDVSKHPMEVRERIGYLPEHNPVYKEMYVKEYLNFIARMHKIKDIKGRVGEMIEMTGLEREQHKHISSLSKGYRQRVGLAQAMIHDPEVLILDEPTSGLDPNQLVEIRSLIKNLGKEKTVIFSTHIMQEVQALCDRVVIINKGEMVANDSIEVLKRKVAGEQIITIELKEKVKSSQLAKIDGIYQVKAISDHRWQLISQQQDEIRDKIFHFAVDQKLTLLEMHKEVSSVEDIFQKLTRQSN
ncbi:MAG: gliding motility-associated ABC transporter ATP-binding subunit GldA [Saprospiraceae bacterium]|nr:gliding motility-associated ABC transporter ATP-binding subunit GldA [Saprospiraceae bacterium]